jgi:hypothetical protein
MAPTRLQVLADSFKRHHYYRDLRLAIRQAVVAQASAPTGTPSPFVASRARRRLRAAARGAAWTLLCCGCCCHAWSGDSKDRAPSAPFWREVAVHFIRRWRRVTDGRCKLFSDYAYVAFVGAIIASAFAFDGQQSVPVVSRTYKIVSFLAIM